MKIRHLLLGTALVAAMPAIAMAQSTVKEGFYVGGQVGAAWLDGVTFVRPGLANDVSFDRNWTGVLETGYRFGNGFRVGVEGGYASNPVDGIVGGPVGRVGTAGDVSALTLMGVVYYDFDFGPFRPYVGIGGGAVGIDVDGVGPALATNFFFEDSDTQLGAQLAAGFGYAITPNLELTAGYRYITAEGFEVSGGPVLPFEIDYNSHSVMVGLRWTFGQVAAPPPPVATPAAAPAASAPPPPPPPAITRNFMVFFDWDKSDLTADARQVLNNVAAAARTGSIASVQVTGHADTSGSDEYNQRLSMRRAEAVREYLVGLGLGAGQIAIDAKGETELMVPTADGVREPSNRRAVIIFP